VAGPRYLLPTLTVVSAALTAIILGPLLRSGHLLYRDAVSTPRSFLTDTTLGLGGVAARATPQDAVVAAASRVVDGGIVVVVITGGALILAGVGYGRLAARLVPSAGTAGACVAAGLAIWNPYVAERLLQGHWSLLVSFAALGWIVVAADDIRRGSGRRDVAPWAHLALATAAAGFIPTGSVLAAVMLGVILMAPLLRRRRWTECAATAGIWVLGALPWLTATALGTAPSTTGADGFAVFGIRAEPGLGTLGTVAGLGGIWNADAVPASRTIWWAAVATLAMLLIVTVGSAWLWRHRTAQTRLIAALAGIALVTAGLVALAAVGPVADELSTLSTHVPGIGLFRDTQKYLALLVPYFTVAAAGAVAYARRWVPAGFAVAAAALLIVAPLPDLAWGVGGSIRPITYPGDWARVSAAVSADHGAVAVWPTGAVRRYSFADGPSLNPLPRMVRAPVTESGLLTVDGVVVDPASGRGADVDKTLTDGGSPSTLAGLGVGWVVVESASPPADLASSAAVVFRGEDLTLYRIPGPIADLDASTAARVTVLAAHVIWVSTILLALATAAITAVSARGAARRQTPR
jgi:hypothetical protein